MRLYLPPGLSSLLSTAVAIVALAAVCFLGFKAWDIYSNDPSLKQLPGLVEESKSK